MIFVAEDLKSIVTSNVSSATVSIIEKSAGRGPRFGPGGPPPGVPNLPLRTGPVRPPIADWDETVVPVGHGSEGFDVSPEGKEIWVVNAGIQMQPDGARAFVSCTPDDYVTIIDLKSLEVTGHLDVSKEPDGLAWAVRK